MQTDINNKIKSLEKKIKQLENSISAFDVLFTNLRYVLQGHSVISSNHSFSNLETDKKWAESVGITLDELNKIRKARLVGRKVPYRLFEAAKKLGF